MAFQGNVTDLTRALQQGRPPRDPFNHDSLGVGRRWRAEAATRAAKFTTTTITEKVQFMASTQPYNTAAIRINIRSVLRSLYDVTVRTALPAAQGK
ncbi:hypothetical protein QBC43DRAFT_355011 [Cladorrhinum sp. PSN259]|nr:hypothetical protein QBC43DRAFT_355011 [Cladorrhinum sp. PSN259]